MNQLPDEMYENILLESKDLSVCLTNKKLLSICQKKDFWYKKFNKENLPFDWIDVKKIHTINEWIDVYDKILAANMSSKKLINLFKHLHLLYPKEFFSIFSYSNDITPYYNVLPNYIKQLENLVIERNNQEFPEDCQYMFNIRLYENKKFYLWIYLEDDQGDMGEQIEIKLSLDEIQTVLMRWLYFVKYNDDEVQLVDENCYSYFYEDLINLMNITQLNKRTNQYRMLQSRLEFLHP
jgi:hypothetical protein